jgi:HK97 family phage major capsid protein
MADIADGAYPCFFGDLTKGYAIFERVGMETEMDRLASNRMWNHITRMRVGGKVRNSNALVLLEVTAAKI